MHVVFSGLAGPEEARFFFFFFFFFFFDPGSKTFHRSKIVGYFNLFLHFAICFIFYFKLY